MANLCHALARRIPRSDHDEHRDIYDALAEE